METPVNPIQDIATDVVALCRAENYQAVYDKYFTEKTRAIEPMSMDGKDPVTVWKSAIMQKAMERSKNVDTVSLEIDDPSMVNGNQFIVKMAITTKNKETGAEHAWTEYVLYTVEEGKIIEERFFYCM